jgi:hypothetical protein
MHLSRINKLNATILDIPNLYVHACYVAEGLKFL